MSSRPRLVIVATILLATGAANSAERVTTTSQAAFACVSWAAWHEYGLASLSARGARASKLCPLRLPAGTKVVVVEDDAGEGASEIRYRSKSWFVDNQRLN